MAEYLIQSGTLTGIADAIREKTGSENLILPEEMPGYIRDIRTDNEEIPADIIAEADRVAANMTGKISSNAVTFVAMADLHQQGDGEIANATYAAFCSKSIRDAGWGAKLIAEQVNLDFVANLGDLPLGTSETTVQQGVEGIITARIAAAEAESVGLHFRTPGDTDPLTYGRTQTGEYLSPDVVAAMVGDYRSVDLEEKKVRIICLNTADNRGAEILSSGSSERISGEQLQWFAGMLDLSGKEDGEQWKILILSHHPLDWGNIRPAGNCLAAYLAGESFSCSHEGVEVSYDFSGKNAAKIIGQFHGHTHCFKVDAIYDNRSGFPVATSVKRIAIPNAGFHRSNERGTTELYGLVYGEETTYEKTTDNTGKSTAFCLVSVDLDGEVIYADCFGAGYDRVIPYGNPQ